MDHNRLGFLPGVITDPYVLQQLNFNQNQGLSFQQQHFQTSFQRQVHQQTHLALQQTQLQQAHLQQPGFPQLGNMQSGVSNYTGLPLNMNYNLGQRSQQAPLSDVSMASFLTVMNSQIQSSSIPSYSMPTTSNLNSNTTLLASNSIASSSTKDANVKNVSSKGMIIN